MSAVYDTVSDLQKSYFQASVVNALYTDSIADLDVKKYNVDITTESIADAKRRWQILNTPGPALGDTLADLERKQYLNYFSQSSSSNSNNDLEYSMYKGLAP